MLYLRGLSTGDFREALAALLGDDAAGLSATNIARLTNEWETEYRVSQKGSLADRYTSKIAVAVMRPSMASTSASSSSTDSIFAIT